MAVIMDGTCAAQPYLHRLHAQDATFGGAQEAFGIQRGWMLHSLRLFTA